MRTTSGVSSSDRRTRTASSPSAADPMTSMPGSRPSSSTIPHGPPPGHQRPRRVPPCATVRPPQPHHEVLLVRTGLQLSAQEFGALLRPEQTVSGAALREFAGLGPTHPASAGGVRRRSPVTSSAPLSCRQTAQEVLDRTWPPCSAESASRVPSSPSRATPRHSATRSRSGSRARCEVVTAQDQQPSRLQVHQLGAEPVREDVW